MNEQSDSQLLCAYAQKRSEAAFAELVRRHIDFVYSAALRMVRDAHLAEDVTQSAFVALARNATELKERAMLSGWLHRTAQNIAAQTVRTIERRRAREQEAAAMNELFATEPEGVWEHIAPHLDAALGELSEADRDALLLRYFERKSAQDMAQVLGVSDEAAQKRVSRAVERLREFLAKRGVTTGVSGLVLLISTNAVLVAPAGLSAAITTAALAGAAIATTAVATTKAISMTTLQKTILATALAAAVGTGVYEARQAALLRTELQQLRQKQAGNSEQVQRERDEALAQLSTSANEIDRLKSASTELLELRAEATRLRAAEQELTRLRAVGPGPANTPVSPAAAGNYIELTRESWADAGFATPQDALRTRGWSVVNANFERFKDSVFVTESTRKALEDAMVRMLGDVENPLKAKTLQEFRDKQFAVEEALFMRMKGENMNRGYTGYRILSQQSPSAEETILEVQTEMDPSKESPNWRKELLRFRRFGNDWKVVVDRDFGMSPAPNTK